MKNQIAASRNWIPRGSGGRKSVATSSAAPNFAYMEVHQASEYSLASWMCSDDLRISSAV